MNGTIGLADAKAHLGWSCRAFVSFIMLTAWCGVCASPAPATPYQTFCSLMAPGTRYQQNEAADAARLAPMLASDPVLARRIRDKLQLRADPTIVARQVQAAYLMKPIPEIIFASDLNAADPHWWAAYVNADGSLRRVGAATSQAVRAVVDYPRNMAAFIVLNELLGHDEAIPRDGCDAVDRAWFALYPGVLPDLHAAIETPPEQSLELASAIHEAWMQLPHDTASPPTQLGITLDTFKAVGADPQITAIYRDYGLPGDGIGEIDVVRIGDTPHAYAIVRYEAGKPVKLSPIPICVVGDLRCADTYIYGWP